MSEQTTALAKWTSHVPQTVSDAVETIIPFIPDLAPPSLDPQKFLTRLQLVMRNTEHIEECDPVEVASILIDIVSLGLEPGTEVSLVVFKSNKQNRYLINKMVEYQGWYRLLADSPRIKKIVCDVVREKDEFYQDRMNDEYRHVVPNIPRRGEIVAAYCMVILNNGERLVQVLDQDDLERHQRSARNGGVTGPWNDHRSQMCKKSALQSFANQHRGLINLIARDALASEESSQEFDYVNSAGSEDAYNQAVADLFGDRTETLTRGRELVGELIEVGEALESQSALSAAEPEASEVQLTDEECHEAFCGQLVERVRELKMTQKQVAKIVEGCGGGSTPLQDIREPKILVMVSEAVEDFAVHQKPRVEEGKHD